MKRNRLSLGLVTLIALLTNGCGSDVPITAQPDTWIPDRNVTDYAEAILRINKLDYKESELIAFGQSAELILKIINAEDGDPLTRILRPYPSDEKVTWEDIVREVMSGNVVHAWGNHSLDVGVYTRNGRHLVAKEPRIDALSAVCKEVDPKNLFISYDTE